MAELYRPVQEDFRKHRDFICDFKIPGVPDNLRALRLQDGGLLASVVEMPRINQERNYGIVVAEGDDVHDVFVAAPRRTARVLPSGNITDASPAQLSEAEQILRQGTPLRTIPEEALGIFGVVISRWSN